MAGFSHPGQESGPGLIIAPWQRGSGEVVRAREAHSLAASHPQHEKRSLPLQHRSSSVLNTRPQTRSSFAPDYRRVRPSDSARAAARGWRLLAAEPLTGTLRAALLGTCARAAPLGAIRLGSAILVMLCVKRATEKPTLSKIV